MGCRLCINIKNNGKILGNVYFQSSGYFNEMVKVIDRLLGDLNGINPTISVDKLSKIEKKDFKKSVAILIFELFQGLGCYYILSDDDRKKLSKVDNNIVNEFFEDRYYMFGNILNHRGQSCICNVAAPTLYRGDIGLFKSEIKLNEYGATYIIDVHIDRKILDFNRYFCELSDDIKKESCYVSRYDFLEVSFNNFNKVFSKLFSAYCSNKNFYNNKDKKIYICE